MADALMLSFFWVSVIYGFVIVLSQPHSAPISLIIAYQCSP
jgi:hypothetical protein